MRPKRIFLIRHGESIGNVNRETYRTVPDWKVPLTEKGQQQAQDAGDELSKLLKTPPCSLGVYVSPYQRTRETWNNIKHILYSWQQPRFVKEDPRLREQEWGGFRAYDGRSWQEVERERDAYGQFFYRFPQGESGADVYDRCTGFLDTLYRDFEKVDFPENVLIISHGFTLRVLLMRWLHWTVEEFQELKNPRNGQRFELQLDMLNHYQLTEPFPRRS